MGLLSALICVPIIAAGSWMSAAQTIAMVAASPTP